MYSQIKFNSPINKKTASYKFKLNFIIYFKKKLIIINNCWMMCSCLYLFSSKFNFFPLGEHIFLSNKLGYYWSIAFRDLRRFKRKYRIFAWGWNWTEFISFVKVVLLSKISKNHLFSFFFFSSFNLRIIEVN